MKVYADVVATMNLPGGKKRYVKIGVVLQPDHNDASRGPGLMVMLDRHINLAAPGFAGSETSIALSTYWPKADEHQGKPKPNAEEREERAFRETDDDIPF